MVDRQRRQIAHIANVSDLIQGNYVKQEGWQPNYIETKDGRHISRINLMATVVSIQNNQTQKTMMVDDGTGSISIRSFEESNIMEELDIGDLIMMVGRPREFGDLKYIVPEIIKKIENIKWVEVRQKQLMALNLQLGKETPVPVSGAVKEPITEIPSEKESNPKLKVYHAIRSLDNGDGADTEEVLKTAGVQGGEEVIRMLLQEGEIFEIKKGRLKIL